MSGQEEIKVMGRLSKLTPELQKEICGYISVGNTFERSCILANIAEKTFYIWKSKGRESKNGKYVQFLQAVKKAEEEFKRHHIANIAKASDKGIWQASAWLLERKYPEEFGRREKIDVHSERLEEAIEAFRGIK